MQIVFEARGRNLFFSADPEKWIAEADMVFVSVNTPTKTSGLGAGRAADLSFWEGAARMIAGVSKSSKIIVEKSTVPVKTAEAIGKVCEQRCCALCMSRQRWLHSASCSTLGGQLSLTST